MTWDSFWRQWTRRFGIPADLEDVLRMFDAWNASLPNKYDRLYSEAT